MPPETAKPLSPAARCAGCALLVAVTLAVFLPVTRGELVYDDLYIIAQNPLITSFSHLPEILRSAYWDFLDPRTAAQVGYYRPLVSVILTAGYVLGGGSALVFHWISLLAHVGAVLAAWLFAARLTRSEAIGFFAALLFALHPVQVESVAWISAVNVPLCALFSLLALAVWLGWLRAGSKGLPWASGVFLLLALLCKEAAIAVLPMALAIDFARRLPAREGPRAAGAGFAAHAPFLLAGLLYYIARVLTFGDLAAGFDRVTTDFGVPASRLALLRVELLGGAIGLLALPLEPSLFRPFRPELALSSRAFLEPLAWLVVLGLAIGYFAKRRARTFTAATLLVPAALLPVLVSVRSLGTFPLSDRFLYLPALGFTLLLSALALKRLPLPAALVLLVSLAGAYAWRSTQRIPDWHDELALFSTALEQSPQVPSAHWGMGRVLLARYRAEADPSALDEARASYQRSMDLLERARTDPSLFATSDDHRQTNLGLAWTLLLQAQLDELHDYETPKVIFERVTRAYPTYEMGWIGLAVALTQLGETDRAGEALRKALDLNPRSVEAHHNMAALMLLLRDWKAAEHHYRQALRYRHNRIEDLVGLARALELQDDREEAWSVAMQARELHPGSGDPCVILASIATVEGRLPEALAWLDEAVHRSPRHGPAHLRRGTLLATLGRPKEAVLALQKACQLMPNEFDAFYNLSALLLASDTPQAALPALVRAYKLRPAGELGVAVHQSLVDLEITDANLLWQLAAVDTDRAEGEKALFWARRALERDPAHAPSHFIVGLLLSQSGELESALEHLGLAAAALSENYQVQREYGTQLARAGRTSEALFFLRKAQDLLPKEELPDTMKLAFAESLAKEIASLEGR